MPPSAPPKETLINYNSCNVQLSSLMRFESYSKPGGGWICGEQGKRLHPGKCKQ